MRQIALFLSFIFLYTVGFSATINGTVKTKDNQVVNKAKITLLQSGKIIQTTYSASTGNFPLQTSMQGITIFTQKKSTLNEAFLKALLQPNHPFMTFILY